MQSQVVSIRAASRTPACGCCSATTTSWSSPGEAVEFSTLVPHWFGVVDGPVEAIGIFGPQGERVHLHDG